MRLESFGMTAKKCWIERPFSRRKRRLTLYFWRYIFLWKTHLFPLNRWKYLKYWFFSAKWHAICLFYDYYLSFAQNSLKRSRTLRSNFMLNLVGICLPIFICLDLWKQNWRPNQTFFLGRGDDRKIKRRVSLFSRALVYIFSFYFCPFPISVFFFSFTWLGGVKYGWFGPNYWHNFHKSSHKYVAQNISYKLFWPEPASHF